jgi:hypothetical protein
VAYPTIAVKASLSTSRFATPSYTTLPAADVDAIDIEAGRKSELDGTNPGTLGVRLHNDTRTYDPRNTAGTYYPNLTPGKKVQVTATFDDYAGAGAASYVGAGALVSGDNASLTPALPAGWRARPEGVPDLFVCLASIRNSGTGTVNVPTGWFAIVNFGNVALLGRYAQLGDTAPTITFTGGASGDTTLAHIIALRDVEVDPANLVIASATQLNASAQNIAVPNLTVGEGGIVLIAGWKQDDWTSVAALTGQLFNEAIDVSSTTGNDAGHVLDYRVQSGATNVFATNLVVTGGASAISRSIVVGLRPYRGTTYQLFNGWTTGFPNTYGARTGSATMKATGPFAFLAKMTIPDPYTATVQADTPTGWYRLNEGSGQILTDSSGHGRHGRWMPELADVKTTTGLIAGSDSAVSLPSGQFAVGKIPAAAMPSLKGQSIEFWVKIDKPPQPLDVPLELSAEMWSSLLFGGGVNIRVWAATSAYPGAVDFIIGDDASLMTAHLAIATTAFADTYWYYNIADGRVHHVVCTINAAANLLCIYVDGVDRAPFNNFVGTIASIAAYAPIDINASPGWDGSCVMDELAFYNTELSSTQVATHYAAGAVPWRGDTTGARIGRALTLVGWPASLTDLDAGQSILGTFAGAGTKALDYLDKVTATEQGWLSEARDDSGKVRFQDRSAILTDARSTQIQMLFSDAAADLSAAGVTYSAIGLATDDRPAANVVTVKWLGGDVTVSDAASVNAYGEIAVTITTISESEAEASSLASWALIQRASLFTRITSVTIRPNRMSGTTATRAWVACHSLREGDRVRVRHTPASSGAQIDQQLYVLGVEHSASDGANDWETTLHLGPAITTTYWVLGTGALDSTAVLAF